MYTLKGEENPAPPVPYPTLRQALHRQHVTLSSQQQSKVNTFTSILQMRKQKLCELKVMETASDWPPSVWLQTPCPFPDTLPPMISSGACWPRFCDCSGVVLKAQGLFCSLKLSLFFCLQFRDLSLHSTPADLLVVMFPFTEYFMSSGFQSHLHKYKQSHFFLPYPFSLLLIKSYVQTKQPESYLGQWNTLICFYVESMNCPWRFALSFLPN